MENKREFILDTKRTLKSLRSIENEKLYHLLNNTYKELAHLNKEHVPNNVIANEVRKNFEIVYESVLNLIKKENSFILPYIEKILNKYLENDSDTIDAYNNLTVPLKDHIIKQNKMMDKLEELKAICFSSTADNYYGKIMLDIIGICELFERKIYIEQRILIPGLIHLIEDNETILNTNYASI